MLPAPRHTRHTLYTLHLIYIYAREPAIGSGGVTIEEFLSWDLSNLFG